MGRGGLRCGLVRYGRSGWGIGVDGWGRVGLGWVGIESRLGVVCCVRWLGYVNVSGVGSVFWAGLDV